MVYDPEYMDPKVNPALKGAASWDFTETCSWVREKRKHTEETSAEKYNAIVAVISGETPPAEIRWKNRAKTSLDKDSLDGWAVRNREEWVEYANDLGLAIASMSDIYHASKESEKRDDAVLNSLKLDFKASRVIPNTKIMFNRKNLLMANIIHHDYCELMKPVWQEVVVPESPLQGYSLNEIDSNFSVWAIYLRALFGTKDTLNEIKIFLQRLSDYNDDQIQLYTPDMYWRQQKGVADTGLEFNIGGFKIYGNYDDTNRGRSRQLVFQE